MKFLPQELKARRSSVKIWIGEHNQDLREALRATLVDAGFTAVQSYAEFTTLKNAFGSTCPDILIAANTMDGQIIPMIKDLRYQRLGMNPFLLTILLMDDDEDDLKAGVNAGVDTIIMKPVSGKNVLERIAVLSKNRLPFIVTNDYVGPERRKDPSRGSAIRQIPVLNTVERLLDGETLTQADVKSLVSDTLEDMKIARLDSHAFRLGFLCNQVVTAYREEKVGDETVEQMKQIMSTTAEAAVLAREIKASQMADITFALKDLLKPLVASAKTLDEDDCTLLSRISTAVVKTLKGKHDNAAYAKALQMAIDKYGQAKSADAPAPKQATG